MDKLKKKYNSYLKLLDHYLDKALGSLTENEYNHVYDLKIKSDDIIRQLYDEGIKVTTSEILNGFKEDLH